MTKVQLPPGMTRRALWFVVFWIPIVAGLTYVGVVLVKSLLARAAEPVCWDAPQEALGASDTYWRIDQHGKPLFCVRWIGHWNAEGTRRPTLAARCWRPVPQPAEVCKRDPAGAAEAF